jgi:tungstate transport system ATP-binding protein
LSGVTLSIHAGERVALIGANCSGKSTLLRVLHGLVPHAAGVFVSHVPPQAQAMLFQRPHMMRMSVCNNVALALWLHGVPWRNAQREAMAALGRVGLAGVAGRNARTLSGGQQQRMALARAWALKPAVLLLDEPTSGMSHAETDSMIALVASLPKELGVLMIEHDMNVVFSLAHTITVLYYGEVLASGPPAAIRENDAVRKVYLGMAH